MTRFREPSPREARAPPPVDRVVEPEEELADRLAGRLERWRALYRTLKPEMRRSDGAQEGVFPPSRPLLCTMVRCMPKRGDPSAHASVQVAIEIIPCDTSSMMKTTIELPEPTHRQAESLAISRGMTLKQFFTEALEEKLRRCVGEGSSREAPWMAGFGALSDLAGENRRVLGVIEEEFETIAPDDSP